MIRGLDQKKIYHEHQQVHEIDLKLQKVKFRYGFLFGFLDCVQLLIIYIFAIEKYQSGMIALSSFVMYINATELMTDALAYIANAVSSLHNISFYYKDFDNFLKKRETMRESGAVKKVRKITKD